MPELNVELENLATTEEMDFSYRGTPLLPVNPEHYTNKAYVDTTIARQPAALTIPCDGVTTTYLVEHNLNTKDIASVVIYDASGPTPLPIGMDWEPTTVNSITLKPDVLLPDTMSLRVVVSA